MSPASATNLFKRVRPTVGRVGLITMGTSIPKQRVKYSMRHARNNNIQVSDAAMTDKALRKQLHRRQPPASVSARRNDIRQHDILRRRTIHFSMEARLPSFARAGKLSKFTSVSGRLAIVLACEARIHEIITLELNAASPDINTALHAAVKIQQDFGLFDSVDGVADIFVACLRKLAPANFHQEQHTLHVDRDWDFFWSVYRYLTMEAEWGRLRGELYNLYKVLENVVAFTKLKTGVETSVCTEKFDSPMDLSEYLSCGPDPGVAWQTSVAAQATSAQALDGDSEMKDCSIPVCAYTPAVTSNSTPATQSMTDTAMSDPPPAAPPSMTPAAPSSAMSSSNAVPLPAPAPPAAAPHSSTQFTSFGLNPKTSASASTQLSAATSHSNTNFMPYKAPPVQVSPAPARPAAPSHSKTKFTSFGGPPPR